MNRFFIAVVLVLGLSLPALAQDTQRSKSACATLLADNTSGDISPQDLRDCLVASVPYLDGSHTGSLIVTDGSAAAPGLAFCHPTAGCDYGWYYSAGGLYLSINGSVAVGTNGVVWNSYVPISPSADNVRDLGTVTQRWQDVYTLNVKADDSGTAVTIPAIDNDGSPVVFSDYITAPAGASTVPSINFSGSPDTGFSMPSSSSIYVVHDGAQTHRLTNTALVTQTVRPFADAGDDLGTSSTAWDETFTDEIRLNSIFTTAPVACSSAESGRMFMHDDEAGNTGLCVCRESSSSWAYESLTTGGSC